MTRIALLGTGAMGSRMAANLLTAGYDVTVWNRNRDKIGPLLDKGAGSASSPHAAAGDADIVISMVRDDQASRAVWLDKESGALVGMRRESVAIESSTLTVAWARDLAAACRAQGIAFLDAPVLGSRPQAEAAQLIFFAGGEEETVERVRPILLSVGNAVHHTGSAGSGAAVKLMANALFGLQQAALGELLGLAGKLGLDESRVVEILTSTPVCSPMAKTAAEMMLNRNFSPLFPIELVEKDLSYVTRTAAANQAETPLSEAVRQVFSRARQEGYGEENITGVARLYL